MDTHTLRNNKSGFALVVAVAITGTLLLITTGLVNLAVKQALISASARDSQMAFYAADSAMECALFWDVSAPSGATSFATTTTADINCNYTPSNPSNHWTVGGASVSTINTITFNPDSYCAKLVVTKNANNTTLVQAYGYNTCDTLNPRRVERAVQATY